MSSGRGLIRGFLVGVAVTLIVGGGIGYIVYERIQTAVSPETIRETTEEALARILGGRVQVGAGEVSLPNLLTLTDVELNDDHGEIVSIERVELVAEGGLQGLKGGRFGQIRLVHPEIRLERRGEEWNLVDFLKPLLGRMAAGPSDASVSASPEHHALPLRVVEISDLDFQVSLGDTASYSGISAESISISKATTEAPWDLHCRRGRLRLNPAAEQWPLLETYRALLDLIPAGPNQTEKGRDTRTPERFSEDGWPGKPEWLGSVVFDDFAVELIHPGQTLSLSGLSFRMDRLSESFRIQTGELKKKTPLPKT